MTDSSARKILWPETVAGVLLFAAGLACAVFLAASLANDLSIWVLGRAVSGQVTEHWIEQIGDRTVDDPTFHFHIRYSYTTADGRVFSREATLSAVEWSKFNVGNPIDVIYFPLAPTHARLADRRFIPIYACAYIPFAIVAWAGLRAGRHLLRQGVGRPKGPGQA
jgi:hypothetical protein